MHFGIDYSRSGTNMPDFDPFQIWNFAQTGKGEACRSNIHFLNGYNTKYKLMNFGIKNEVSFYLYHFRLHTKRLAW